MNWIHYLLIIDVLAIINRLRLFGGSSSECWAFDVCFMIVPLTSNVVPFGAPILPLLATTLAFFTICTTVSVFSIRFSESSEFASNDDIDSLFTRFAWSSDVPSLWLVIKLFAFKFELFELFVEFVVELVDRLFEDRFVKFLFAIKLLLRVFDACGLPFVPLLLLLFFNWPAHFNSSRARTVLVIKREKGFSF